MYSYSDRLGPKLCRVLPWRCKVQWLGAAWDHISHFGCHVWILKACEVARSKGPGENTGYPDPFFSASWFTDIYRWDKGSVVL